MRSLLLICLLLCSPFLNAQEEKDHPLFPAFEGARIYQYEETSFEPYRLVTSSVNSTYTSSKDKKTEGRIFRIFYTMPTDKASVYEVFTNFKKALQTSEAETIFSCYGDECGDIGLFWKALEPARFQIPVYYGERFAYHAANFSKDGKAYYVAMVFGYGLGEQGYEIHVVEAEEMEQKVDLNALESALNEKGMISVYGITFDTGSAQIKPESDSVLKEIANYLNKNPSVNLYVVGHTDDVGAVASNLTLSQNRSAAVVKRLTSKFGVNSAQLESSGVGPYAPVSNNASEDGRAKNRRVELVKRLK